MDAPGGLDELGAAGRAAWSARVAHALAHAVAELTQQGRAPDALTDSHERVPELRAPEWPAFPSRIAACMGDARALALLDWRPAGEGDAGRALHQEEYLEWRTVREDGALRRIEMTTELPDYWRVLAAHEPHRALELVAAFAGEPEVPSEAVYGALDPFADGVGADERGAAFAATMLLGTGAATDPRRALADVSAYNDGRRALCCMLQPSNTLSGLVMLVASAARTLTVRDDVTGRTRFASGSEAIAALGAVAVDGRNSDPLIVERIVRLATERRPIGFDDPLGVYVCDVQHHELAQPDGEDVPVAWFRLERGLLAAEAPDGRQRCQRLAFEVPHDADFALEDLVVRRSGERLRFGGQLARLVQLAVHVRTGPPA